MWLSNRMVRNKSNQPAVGEVTIGGKNTAVYTDGEKRNSVFFSPGGYYWLPSRGQNMVVIKSEDNEICCMDREITELPIDMQEGEVYIVSDGNASIYLKNDGTVQISGDVSVKGRMFVNGTEIG